MLLVEQEIEYWISLGDSVGLFPEVNETLDLIRQVNCKMVAGDHEIHLISGVEMLHSFTGNEAIKIQRNEISKDNLKFLKTLKIEETIEINGNKLLLIHDLNRSNGEKYLHDFDQLSLNQTEECDFILFGHTHTPTYYKGRTHTYLNPGSLGFPIQRNGAPSYAVLNLETHEVQFKRLQVNQEAVLRALENSHYNYALTSYLLEGYKWPNR
jgi:putative phosphoesterase